MLATLFAVGVGDVNAACGVVSNLIAKVWIRM